MTDPYQIIIPARYASSRLPGKVLEIISGKPLLQHVYEAASNSQAESVLVATDDERIACCADNFGADVIMTAVSHSSGSERLAEVVTKIQVPDESVIVNLQGDEIGMPPALLDQVAGLLINDPTRNMATLCEPLDDEQSLHNPNIVKVVFDKNGTALYFSRAPIPWPREGDGQSYRHIGLYAYRAGFLKTFSKMQKTRLESIECLEQLRALYHGERIIVDIAVTKSGMGIDTMDDLKRARQHYQ